MNTEMIIKGTGKSHYIVYMQDNYFASLYQNKIPWGYCNILLFSFPGPWYFTVDWAELVV
jgi:hypothetical protein